jgi:hypothetical protein
MTSRFIDFSRLSFDAGRHLKEPEMKQVDAVAPERKPRRSPRRSSAVIGPRPRDPGLLPKLVIACAVVLVAAGVIWHGVALDVFERIGRNLMERPSGAMAFRFILQPSMAAIAAINDHTKAARTGRGGDFGTAMHDPAMRPALLREGLNATARIILLGIAMDLLYQFLVFDTFFPVEALSIAVLLAYVPYLIVRVLFLVVLRRLRGGASAGGSR